MPLMFRPEGRHRVANGEITVTYRLWARSHVKAGNRYETGFGTVEVEDVLVIPAGMIPESDVPLTGCDSVDAIRALAAEHKRATLSPDTLLHRVQFRFLKKKRTPKA